MREAPRFVRSAALFGSLVGVAALSLSACGTNQAASEQQVNGTPSINISVPLTGVACTMSDSCIAVGTSQSDGAPSTAGEVRLANGRWIVLAVPTASSAFITGASCAASQCLLVGQDASGDLIWRYDATQRTVTPIEAPSAGTGVTSVSCATNQSCVIADSTHSGPRILTTTDAGATWTTQSTPTTSDTDRIVQLSCPTALHCLAMTQLGAGGVDISVTSDGALSWTTTATSTSSSATTVSSLSCVVRQCVMVFSTGSGTSAARSTNFGATWSDLDVTATPGLVACATAKDCVIAGQSGSTPWIETTAGRHVSKVTLNYVPSPIEALACGARVCVGVAATTVVSVRP